MQIRKYLRESIVLNESGAVVVFEDVLWQERRCKASRKNYKYILSKIMT